MAITLDQLLPFVVVIGAAIGAMIFGYKRGGSEKQERTATYEMQPMQQWFFDGPLKEHFRLMQEQNEVLRDIREHSIQNGNSLREILDLIAPRRTGNRPRRD